MLIRTIAVAAAMLTTAGAGQAATCGNDGAGFAAWLQDIRQEAAAEGVSEAAVEAGLAGVTYDKRVIARDRSQTVFAQAFLEFAGRMVSRNRLETGEKLLARHKSIFTRIEEEYGVPAPVLVAFWGLETDFGANTGDFNTIRSLATLAYDCRRPEKFRLQLFAALRIIESGDLAPEDMIGAWAGEIGQAQFLPLDYIESSVDFDGDGRSDLRNSVPDVLASSANLLVKAGWRRGQPWLQEVNVPEEMPWQEADIAIRHSRAQWAEWGIRTATGKPIKADASEASLLLPMGRHGPAFLAYPNFTEVYLKWNESLVYATTAAYYATRLAGAPKVSEGNGGVEPLTVEQMVALQNSLSQRGYDVGKIDGMLGAKTRAAVKDTQRKLGLPADSYPTAELLAAL